LEEPEIKKSLTMVKNASMIVYSIGNAMEMAKRRGLSAAITQQLKDKRATAEAFGDFYNEKGQIVYELPNIGLQATEVEKIPQAIAMAGGKKKAKAIYAYFLHADHENTTLITDEVAAKELLRLQDE